MAKKRHRYKVLVIAEAANPEWTSVPLVGWSLAHALRKVADVHLVTQIRNKEAILKYGYIEGVDFTAIDSEPVAQPLHHLGSMLRGGKQTGWTTGTAINSFVYYYFEWLVWKYFKKDIQEGKYDFVHRVTPLTPTAPSLLAKKCHKAGVPFILGPLNGGAPWPKGFDNTRRQEKEWLSYVRSAYKLMPGYQSTLKASKAILVASQDTKMQLPEKFHSKCVYLPENAIDPEKFSRSKTHNTNSILKTCFVGRLVPYKGPDMLLAAALPLLKQNKLHLDIIGDGPLLQTLQQTVKKENIEQQVTLHGWVAHAELQPIMQESHLFTFPSIREFGGGVVLEAMALGLVPIVVDYAGPGELVQDDFGFKVPIGSREEIIRAYSSVLKNIVESNLDIKGMGKKAQKRVEELFTWTAKAKQIHSVYRWIADKEDVKPVLF